MSLAIGGCCDAGLGCSYVQIDPLPTVQVREPVVDVGRELFDHQRDCAVHDVRADSREKLGRGCSCRFHGLTEQTTRILRCSDCQLLLEATKPAHFVHEGQVSAQISAKEFRSLASHTSCLLAW